MNWIFVESFLTFFGTMMAKSYKSSSNQLANTIQELFYTMYILAACQRIHNYFVRLIKTYTRTLALVLPTTCNNTNNIILYIEADWLNVSGIIYRPIRHRCWLLYISLHFIHFTTNFCASSHQQSHSFTGSPYNTLHHGICQSRATVNRYAETENKNTFLLLII